MNCSGTLIDFRRCTLAAVSSLLLASATSVAAQQSTLSLGSGSATPGGSVALNLTLSDSGGAAPVALQWTMTYPAASITGVTVAAGPSASAAGKSPACTSSTGSTTCVLFGMNQSVISDGIVATATFNVSSSATGSSFAVQISSVAASTLAGNLIAGAGQGGTISISQPPPPPAPNVTGISCSPTTLTGPASSSCFVTLSALASSAVNVSLSSSSSSLSVPATVSVPVGAASAGFVANALAVSASQSAAITASAGGSTQTLSLTLLPGTWSISGAVTPSSLASGATVSLNGGTASATLSSSGNYSFTGLTNGSYTLTPSKTGYTFSPASQTVTISSANITAPAFTVSQNQTTSVISIDTQARRDSSTSSSSITSPSFSTNSGNELLLAFVSADYRSGSATSVRSVSGAGLSWTLVARTNAQRGTAEIWRAFSSSTLKNVSVTANLSQRVRSSMTVITFTGTDTSGSGGSGAIGAIGHGSASSGAPSAPLTTSRNNSLVAGAGNDPTNGLARTAVSGQTVVHQDLDPLGKTFWVQMTASPVAASGTKTAIADSAPASDAYNLTSVEILAAPALTPSAAPASADTSALLTLGTVTGVPTANPCSPGAQVMLSGASSGHQPLARTQVQVNGNNVPVISNSDVLVTFQCPALPAGTALQVTAAGTDGNSASTGSTVMREAAPELFNVGDTSQGVVLLGATNELAMAESRAVNGSTIPGRPAATGERLSVYANGLGARPEGRVVVVAGGVEVNPAAVESVNGTPGLSQIDLSLPHGVPTGPAVPLYLKVLLSDGTFVESNEVTIAIQ